MIKDQITFNDLPQVIAELRDEVSGMKALLLNLQDRPTQQRENRHRPVTPEQVCRVHKHSPCDHLLSTANITKGHRYLVSPWDMDTSLGGCWNGEYNGFYGQNNKNSLFPLWHT